MIKWYIASFPFWGLGLFCLFVGCFAFWKVSNNEREKVFPSIKTDNSAYLAALFYVIVSGTLFVIAAAVMP